MALVLGSPPEINRSASCWIAIDATFAFASPFRAKAGSVVYTLFWPSGLVIVSIHFFPINPLSS